MAITIVDVSDDGLGIELPVAVEMAQSIAIRQWIGLGFAVIRHCGQVSGGRFHVGVEMQHLFQRTAEPPIEETRAGLLDKVLGKRLAAKPAVGR